MKNEYQIEMSSEMERRATIMCNLSEAIEEKGLEKGLYKLYETLNDLVNDGILIIEQAAERAELSVAEFEAKINEINNNN